jgi:hypothetical protein
MAIYVNTPNPNALWASFVAAIKEKKVETWRFHQDGVHITHAAEQWKSRAWFKAVAQQGSLVFNIVKPAGSPITIEVYAEYHALLLRVLLAHFDKQFTSAMVTALAESGDIVAV